MDTVVVPSRDTLTKTKKGMLRSSSGTVTYSAVHACKVELDAQILAQICGDGVPGGGHAWTPSRLSVEFQTRTGRSGVWVHYEIGITSFLLVFPKTFDLFGPGRQYVRLHRPSRLTVLDKTEDLGPSRGRVSNPSPLAPWMVQPLWWVSWFSCGAQRLAGAFLT
eukprot:g10362.t1